MRHLLLLFFTIFLFSACSVKHKNVDLNKRVNPDENIQKLSSMVYATCQDVTRDEANNLAFEAITHSKYLANKYGIVAPALFHNTLINMGFKKRGYCYHYANDLGRYLRTHEYKGFYFIKAVSKRGEYFEHTSLVLTCDKIKFEDSIVLDPWRDTGKLYFSKIKDDDKYDWEIK